MLYGAFQKLLFLKDRSDVDWRYVLDERIKDNSLFVCVQCDVIVAYASVKKYCNRHQLVEFAVADTHLDDPNKSQGCIESIVRHALLTNKGKGSTNLKQSFLEVEIPLKPSSEILGWKNIYPKMNWTMWAGSFICIPRMLKMLIRKLKVSTIFFPGALTIFKLHEDKFGRFKAA